MKRNLLPEIKELGKPPVDGDLHATPQFCKKKYNQDCKKHYDSIVVPGAKLCPYGYLSVAYDIGGGNLKILSAIADSVQANIKALRQGNRLPSVQIGPEVLNFLEAQYDEFKKNQHELQTYQELVHDLRNINQTIKSSAEDVEFELIDGRVDDPFLSQRISSVIAASNLLSQRMSYLRFRQDPKAARTLRAGIHKKFYKALQLFRLVGRATQLNMPGIEGTSHSEVEVYDFFDCLPVILLENAVKYSPPGSDVRIKIEETSKVCTVRVENFGPTISQVDLNQIRRGPHRGAGAISLGIPGTGFGLSFVQQVCQVHRIDLNIELGDVQVFEGKTFQRFIVNLRFDLLQ